MNQRGSDQPTHKSSARPKARQQAEDSGDLTHGLYLELVGEELLNRLCGTDLVVRLLGVDHNALSALALDGVPGTHGISLLPYSNGERTPNRPDATGVFWGLTTDTTREDIARATVEDIARATVEGILCSMRGAMVALDDATKQETTRVLLIGGGAKSEAIRTIAPAIFGVDVLVPEPGEYVAMGAARQAAWVLSGQALPPAWATAGTPHHYTAEPDHDTVARYEELRDLTEGW